MPSVGASSTVLTSPSAGHSTSPRLPRLSQPVDTNLPSDPFRFPDISPLQNTSLHHYDEDVVRELSVPPDTVNPSATTRSRLPHSYGFPTLAQHDGPPSSYLTSPFSHHVPLEHPHPRPRTYSVPVTQPNLFAHHGLPESLPPPPRTTFCSNSHIPPQESVPQGDTIASLFDSMLRRSYSQMLSIKSESSPPTSAPELPPGAEFSLDDMFHADYLNAEFLTSPLLEDSPEETPYSGFLQTPGEAPCGSPMVHPADDSFGCGEMPLFGAEVKRRESSDVKDSESLDILGLLQLYTPSEPAAPSTFESSKMDSVTPVMDPLDMGTMCAYPPTPDIEPASLYTPSHVPSTLPAASSSTPSSSTIDTFNPLRPSKPMPTGTRRHITPGSLVPLDAPTQSRQYVTPSATSRKTLPAAFKGKKRAHSEVDGGGDDDQLLQDGLDPNTQEAIEAKRRQNTLAARRSRQRKLKHVRELEGAVERITQDRDLWMARAYDAEARLRDNGLA